MGSVARPPARNIRSTDVFVSGLDSIEHLDDGMVRLLLYSHKIIEGTLVRVPAPCDLVMPRDALTDGIAVALPETGRYVFVNAGGRLALMD
jgi:hypothetical protein